MKRFTNVRSPLGRVRGLGSAKTGTGHWWWQRLTAVALIPLTLWFIYSLLSTIAFSGGPKNPENVYYFFASSFNTAAMVLLMLGLFYHSMLGIQVILEDYVHTPSTLLVSVVLNKFAHIAFALIAVLSVMKLHFHVPQGMM